MTPALRWRDGLREAWVIATPFWRDRAQRGAWRQLAALVAMTLGLVWINVRFSAWNSAFYDALQARDLPVFWRQIGVFALLAAGYIVVAVLRQVLQMQLTMRWRESLTQQWLGQWLRPGAPYRLEARNDGQPLDNPDQRIADDLRNFVASTLDLALGLLNAGVTLVSFVGILWGLSGSLAVPWPHPGWSLPGYMVWVALAYSLAGSVLARRIGAPLVPTNAQQQKVEADFRYALVQVRDHAEAIALAHGEPAEHGRLTQRFEAVRANWGALIRYTKRLTWFSAGYGQLANVFPLLAVAPRYFAGQVQLGGLMQTAQAFGQVQGAMSWFVDAYASLADWRATVLRLATFRAALVAAGGDAEIAGPQPVIGRGPMLMARDLGVAVPRGEVLLQLPLLWLRPGEWLLVCGSSGSGKSSLLRTLAGLWPARQGFLQVPDGAMFVPQRPYLPRAPLAEVLAYPHAAQRYPRLQLQQALHDAGLSRLVGELDREDSWSRRLSPGEQQRVQFARLFLHRPRWMLLDEATSALDEPAQALLYRRLRRLVPHAAVLSIGHREELKRLHDRVLQVPLVPLTSGAQFANDHSNDRA